MGTGHGAVSGRSLPFDQGLSACGVVREAKPERRIHVGRAQDAPAFDINGSEHVNLLGDKGGIMLPHLKYFHLGDHGLYYGNYGGLDYSAGTENGRITGTPADPAPVDDYDWSFYKHDLALQHASNTHERLEAHVAVVTSVYDLLF
jgi:hypothetical protein